VKKPDPRDEFDESNRGEAYDKAMVDNKNPLVMAFDSAIHKGNFWYRHKDHIAGFVTGVLSSTFVAIAGWLFCQVGQLISTYLGGFLRKRLFSQRFTRGALAVADHVVAQLKERGNRWRLNEEVKPASAPTT
jgi:hypothetical protein